MKKVIRKNRKKKAPFVFLGIALLAVALGVGFWLSSGDETGTDPGTGGLNDLFSSKWVPFLSDSDPAEQGGEEDGGTGYAISSCSEYATAAAAQVLENGGNAADAAVALAYTLSVVEPYASGLGGGGCMVVYDPVEDHYTFYNYAAEAAQSGASYSILVPGMVSGMDALLSDYGTKTYEELLQPAISYCDGFEINAALATRIDAAAGSLSSYSNYVRNGELLSEGDVLVQERLGETLRTLAQEGADSFYHGTIAEQIAAESVLTLDDLAAYETIRTDAVLGQYQGYTVASAAAPFSGVTLIQMLEMAERLEIPDPDEDAKTFLAELQQITLAAHQDRVNGVFDLRFDSTGVDQAERVSDAYIAQMLNLSVEDFEEEEESEDTTAFTIVDSNGMVVSCTNTLSSFFGSKKMAAGFFLNNTGTNFGSGVNAYARGKRPRSHIAPTILRSDDEVIAIASPGGNVIVKVLSTVLMDMLQYHTEPQEAINKQRLLFKKAGLIYYEIGYDTPLLAEVSGKGYALLPYSSHSYFGNVAYASYHTENGFYAATDIRRNGNGVYVNR